MNDQQIQAGEGWSELLEAPDRSDLAAMAELAEPRRVLAITLGIGMDRQRALARREYVLRDSAAVRIEIVAGTPWEDVERCLNGVALVWSDIESNQARSAELDPPDRRDVLAAMAVSEVQRVLAIDVTSRTLIPCQEFVLRDSAAMVMNSPMVRVEIHAGTSPAEVKKRLEWVLDALPGLWEVVTDSEAGARYAADWYGRVNLARETIDGVPAKDWKPARGGGGTTVQGQ